MLTRSGFGTFEFNEDFWKPAPSRHRDIFDPNNTILANADDYGKGIGAISGVGREEEIKRLLEFMRDHPVKEYIVLLSPSAWERLGKPDRINEYEVRVIADLDGWEAIVQEKELDWMRNKTEGMICAEGKDMGERKAACGE